MELLPPVPNLVRLRALLHPFGGATGRLVTVDYVHAVVHWRHD